MVTHELGNHAVCDRRWTYIRYRHGGEELYDRDADPKQWHNLAADPEHGKIKDTLSAWLPENQGITRLPATTAPGSDP